MLHTAPRDVYAELGAQLEPGLTRLGYRRGPGRAYPWWYTVVGDGRVFISAQVDTKATDPFAGGGFRLELERGGRGAPSAKLAGRALFFQLLQTEELGTLLAHQNQVIASLPSPPEAQVKAYPEFLRPQYLSYFRAQDDFDEVRSWLRYRDLADIDRWAEILGPLLPILDGRARSLKADQMYLGRGSISLV